MVTKLDCRADREDLDGWMPEFFDLYETARAVESQELEKVANKFIQLQDAAKGKVRQERAANALTEYDSYRERLEAQQQQEQPERARDLMVQIRETGSQEDCSTPSNRTVTDWLAGTEAPMTLDELPSVDHSAQTREPPSLSDDIN
jgi:hypothetical protein